MSARPPLRATYPQPRCRRRRHRQAARPAPARLPVASRRQTGVVSRDASKPACPSLILPAIADRLIRPTKTRSTTPRRRPPASRAVHVFVNGFVRPKLFFMIPDAPRLEPPTPPKFVRPPRRRSSFGHRAHTEHACRRAAMPSAQFSDAARVRCRGCRTRRHLACTSHRWFLGVWGECRPSRVGKFVHKIVNGFVSAKPFLRSTRVLQCKPPTRCRRSFHHSPPTERMCRRAVSSSSRCGERSAHLADDPQDAPRLLQKSTLPSNRQNEQVIKEHIKNISILPSNGNGNVAPFTARCLASRGGGGVWERRERRER